MTPGMIVFISAIGIIINSYVMLYSANYMDMYDATFGNCFLVSLFATIINAITRSGFGTGGWIVSAIISIALIKFILNASWGRSTMIYIVMIVVYILLTIGLGVLLVGCSCVGVL